MAKNNNHEALPKQGFHFTSPAAEKLCNGECPAIDVCKSRFGSRECQGHRANISRLNNPSN